MKHNNPSGAAVADTLSEAFMKAFYADRLAAFGGAIVLNRAVDKTTAEAINEMYAEVVAAPEYEEGTLDVLARRKNLRILRIRRIERLAEWRDQRFVDFKSLIDGGIIVQQSPINAIRTKEDFQPAVQETQGVVYRPKREPTEREYADLIFGWAVEQGVTSNSVLYVKDGATVGVGTGEQDRVGVAQIAIYKAYTKYADGLCYRQYGIPYYQLELDIAQGKRDPDDKAAIDAQVQAERGNLPGSVMISDAYFPFRDGVDVAIAQGITAIAHPGGSLRDFESIQAGNEADPPVAMVFTGQRAFKH
jgi:phosphoribosylaminoimidazolecarboxamide formyltransferase/IMP cyclohydrolase